MQATSLTSPLQPHLHLPRGPLQVEPRLSSCARTNYFLISRMVKVNKQGSPIAALWLITRHPTGSHIGSEKLIGSLRSTGAKGPEIPPVQNANPTFGKTPLRQYTPVSNKSLVLQLYTRPEVCIYPKPSPIQF